MRLINPGDPGYQARRKAFLNTAHPEQLPTLIACCEIESDIPAALALAQSHGLPYAIRGGGHSFADHSSTTGVLIDLSPLKSIDLDLKAETVRIAPGVQIGELARHLAPHNRLVPCGWCPTVGVMGAVLGGGYGVFSRLYGLGADHLLSASVLLPNGTHLDADPDLLWALRGAGAARFGVVTSMTLRTRPALPATAVQAVVDFSHAAALIDTWQHWAPSAPDEVNLELAIAAPDDPDDPPYAVLFGVVADSEARTRTLLTDLLDPARASLTRLSPAEAACHHSYADGGGGAATTLPPGERPGLRLNKSGFFPGPLPRSAIEDLLTRLVTDRVYGEIRDLELVPWSGAIARVAPTATAFTHRTPSFLLKQSVQLGFRAPTPRREEAHAWLRRAWAPLQPWSTGVYPNYPDVDLPDALPAYYGDNLPRLRKLMEMYGKAVPGTPPVHDPQAQSRSYNAAGAPSAP
ncbi:FAD-binding protein [Nonomuraea sp. NPDC050310]|uniref:FAD-dependent oxidoreductase n=1 Tax=Nonomuraea sp. NPDC050310 TaxID=3154935 RepID=UPI0033D9FF94